MPQSLKPIRTDEEHNQALAQIAALMDSSPGSAEADRLEVLAILVGAYEEKTGKTKTADPIAVLQLGMTAQGRKQSDLADLLGSRSRASEVLNRKRLLSSEMIDKITRAWAIPATLLSAPYKISGVLSQRTVRGVALGVGLLLAAGGAGTAYVARVGAELPNTASIAALGSSGMASAMQPGTDYVRLSDIPPHVLKAFLAAEDKDFYEHGGHSNSAILRAMFSGTRQGASTITQQLAKNIFLHDEAPSISRKVKELILASRIEATWSKDKILETYLNAIYFGGDQWGIGNATQHYFGKAPADISVAEAASLAALPKAPNSYRLDVAANAGRALDRRNWVLGRMAEDGLITYAAATFAQNEPLLKP